MLVLDSTTKSIVATMSGTANTTNPSFVTAYSDNTGTVFTEGSSDGALNGISSVTLVAAPASSTRRLIKTIYISNIDTAAVTVTISYNDNSTLRQIAKVTLQVGDTWSTDGTTDNTGSLKTTAGSVNLSNVTGTLTANGIVYASSTRVLTTGSVLTFDGTNLAIGGTPNSYGGFTTLTLNNTSGSEIDFKVNGSNLGDIYASSSGFYLNTITNVPMVFGVNSSEQMRLNSTGLGIGTSSPAYKLDVSGVVSWLPGVSGAPRGYLSGASSDQSIEIGTMTNNPLGFSTNGTRRLTLDTSGNLGLGVTPSAWSVIVPALQIGSGGSFLASYGVLSWVGLGTNAYYNGSNWIYKTSATASYYQQSASVHSWFTAPSGTAGNAITFTQAMTLDASGNLGIGTTSPSGTNGAGYASRLTLAGTNTALNIKSASNTDFYLGATGGSLVFYDNLNSAERARINSTGSLLVGTTSIEGPTSNDALVVAGRFSTVKNQNQLFTQNTATTAFTMGFAAGIYTFSVFTNASNIGAFSAYAVILYDGADGRILTNVAGGQLTISLSGLNVQVTQTYFSPNAYFYWGYIKQALI